MFAHTSLTIDPAWPGASPGTAWSLLAVAAIVLVGLTVWTYAGVRGASPRRMIIVLVLRLIALADRKSTRLNSSHVKMSYAVFCSKKKNNKPKGDLIYALIEQIRIKPNRADEA